MMKKIDDPFGKAAKGQLIVLLIVLIIALVILLIN